MSYFNVIQKEYINFIDTCSQLIKKAKKYPERGLEMDIINLLKKDEYLSFSRQIKDIKELVNQYDEPNHNFVFTHFNNIKFIFKTNKDIGLESVCIAWPTKNLNNRINLVIKKDTITQIYNDTDIISFDTVNNTISRFSIINYINNEHKEIKNYLNSVHYLFSKQLITSKETYEHLFENKPLSKELIDITTLEKDLTFNKPHYLNNTINNIISPNLKKNINLNTINQ